jgi:hypothetical protein
MIHIHSKEMLLGDCLAQLPFMCAVSKERGDRVHLTGEFNPHIAPLLEPLPIVFEPGGSGIGAETMDISGVLLSINTQSTPDQGTTAANLAGAAVSAKSVLGVTLKGPVSPAAPLPPCTTSPSLIRFDSVQSLLQSTP